CGPLFRQAFFPLSPPARRRLRACYSPRAGDWPARVFRSGLLLWLTFRRSALGHVHKRACRALRRRPPAHARAPSAALRCSCPRRTLWAALHAAQEAPFRRSTVWSLVHPRRRDAHHHGVLSRRSRPRRLVRAFVAQHRSPDRWHPHSAGHRLPRFHESPNDPSSASVRFGGLTLTQPRFLPRTCTTALMPLWNGPSWISRCFSSRI